MVINNRNHRIIKSLVLFLMLSSSPLLAQNLIINGGFEPDLGAIYSSEYTRVYGAYAVEAGCYAIDNTTANHGSGGGWPELTGSIGRFMLVNGFGGDVNSTKIVWSTEHPLQPYIPVSTNTTYTFSCRVVNLNRAYYGQIYPAKLRLKINGQNVGSVNQLPSNNNWQTWEVTWNSGTETQAIIQIVDMYTGNTDYGDDYALDEMSFVEEAYTITTHDDQMSACLNRIEPYNVIGNDVISPNNQGMTVIIESQPSHGAATVDNYGNAQYVFTDANYTGTTDQFSYRVTTHGVTSVAWVFVTLNRPPVVGDIDTPDEICAGGSLGISAPTVTPAVTGIWQYQNENGLWEAFDPTSVPITLNGRPIRYATMNECGEGYSSNPVTLVVSNGPSFTDPTPQIPSFCEGADLDLTPPAFTGNGTPVGWVASPEEHGGYQDFNTNHVSSAYNGWFIRYKLQGSCGEILSQPAVQLVVNVAPVVTGILQVPSAICDSADLDVSAPTFNGNATGVWEICQTEEGNYQPFDIHDVLSSFDGFYLRYKVSNECNYDVSNTVQIRVNEAPEIGEVESPDAICSGSSLELSSPSIQNNGAAITHQGWQIASEQNGDFSAFNVNDIFSYESNGCWIRYFAENECGITTSTAVQVTVNDVPEVSEIVAPQPICEGEAFDLSIPQVNWRHTIPGTGTWEIASTVSGEYTELINNDIPYDYNGYFLRYKAVNGCDGFALSPNVVQITVYSTAPTYDTITACDNYQWNDVFCDHSDDYETMVQTVNGCDVTAYLHFELSDAYTVGHISGSPSVYVASNLINGIYRYEIDPSGVVGQVDWIISNPDWRILESEENYCRVLVRTPGTAILKAHFIAEDCGEMERTFEINAGYFGVGEQETFHVQVYPNPTKGTIHIEAEDIESIRLVDMMGQALKVVECNHSNSLDVNLDGYAPSVYLLEIRTREGVCKKRVTLCR